MRTCAYAIVCAKHRIISHLRRCKGEHQIVLLVIVSLAFSWRRGQLACLERIICATDRRQTNANQTTRRRIK